LPSQTNVAKLLLGGHGRSRPERRSVLQHSDTAASLRSNLSGQSTHSTSSVESLLYAREPDPEEVLLSLGFGGSESLSKIPERFLSHRSKAKGVTITNFVKKEEDLMNRFECGFFGYRGLSGSSSRRPSEIVEKILHTLKERERELRRKNSALSWTTTSSFGASAIPSRFRLMDPQRPTFESIVEAVVHRRPLDHPQTTPRTFRSIARSVLSAENREWREGRRGDAGEGRRRRLVLGDSAFFVDEEGNEEEEVLEADLRKRLEHQDSQDSLVSNTSLDSDWSDEERAELERVFGAMSERGEEQAKIRQLRRSLRRSRRKAESQATYSSAPSSCTLSWDGAKLVYSRESSLSELTSSLASSSMTSLTSATAEEENMFRGWQRKEQGPPGCESIKE